MRYIFTLRNNVPCNYLLSHNYQRNIREVLCKLETQSHTFREIQANLNKT